MPFVYLYVDLLHSNLVGFIAHINFQLLVSQMSLDLHYDIWDSYYHVDMSEVVSWI